jgi:hypothetical protein
MLKFRSNYFYVGSLVIDIGHNAVYFNFDPLISTFLAGKVPVGILLDYIEDHPECICYIMGKEKDSNILIQKIRKHVTDLNELFKD